MFITVQDFKVGKYQLSTGMYDIANLQDYITRYEEKYLVELLGAELFEEFKADVILGGGTPTEQRFIDIFEPFNLDLNLRLVISGGMIEMLTGFIYFEYIKDSIDQITPLGNVIPEGENSTRSTTLYSTMFNRYNEAARSYKAIQARIHQHLSDYCGYNGKKKEFAYWL